MKRKGWRILCMGALGLSAGLGSVKASANELYFGMPVNYDQSEADTLFLYGNAGITGQITSPSGFSSNFTIGSNNVASVVVPSSYDLTTSGLVTNNGFLVSTTNASDKIGASYLSREPFTTDTTYLFDSTALGTSYYAMGYTNTIGYPSQLTVVATKDNTTVTVTPSTNLSSGQQAGVPFQVTLNAGQAVLYTDAVTGGDITGSKVTASAPIAVFGGNQCVDIPSGNYACDHTLSSTPSTDHYTKDLIIPTTKGTEGTSSNIIRVLAATDGTVVTYNGTIVATLNAGEYYDFRSGPEGGELKASNPVQVEEYLTGQNEHSDTVGDPAQTWVPGIDQWLKSYIFSTPVGSQSYLTNFLDIAVLTADIPGLILNGAPISAADCTVIAGTLYSTCEVPIDPGVGTISASDPFLLLLDGGTTYDSYFTFAGATFSPGASPPPSTPPDNPPPPVNPGTIPEPTSLAALGTGLLGLLFLRRRRFNF